MSTAMFDTIDARTVQATKTFYPFGDAGPKVLLFGRNGGLTDWSMAKMQNPTDDPYAAIISQCNDDARVLYAPRPSEFNAVICNSKDLTQRIRGVNDMSNEEATVKMKGTPIMRGVNADGCDVPKGAGFWMSSADCHTIVAWLPGKNQLICSHAGRDCLFDRKRVESGTRSRQYESVVYAIISRFLELGNTREQLTAELQVAAFCGIGPANFVHSENHPKFGKSNRKMVDCFVDYLGLDCIAGRPEDGQLNLPKIIELQFGYYDIPFIRDNNPIDTFSDIDENGQHTWWSTARATTPEEKPKRNGVMVIHPN